jgi:hypothetical protein
MLRHNLTTNPRLFGFYLSCNIEDMRYVDREASLFSGEHIMSQGIYVVGAR